MKKTKNRLLVMVFVFLICFCSFYFYNINENSEIDTVNQKPPISSDISNIITPLNTTYTNGMNGYYPGTYGFEETPDDVLPSYCDYNPGGSSPDGPGSYGRVVDSWTDGAGNMHKKVFKTYDRTGSGTTHGWLNFTNEGSETCRDSTIEFWACNTNTGNYYHSYFQIIGDLGPMVSFEWDSYGTPNDPEIRITPATGEFGTGVNHKWNRWYRYSIDISCDGDYAGLGANQFRFRIYDETGGLIYASADLDLLTAHPTGGPYRYHVLSTQSQSDVSHYLDGFGITGLQDNYAMGDSRYEGLLLSYVNSTILDWQGYSLDSQPNITILGNTTIPMPEEGLHSIQVFGEDSIGTQFQSDLRYFTVDFPIDIITPEEKTYVDPMSGYYPATYGFENDKPGEAPQDWILNTMDASSFVAVDSNLDGHNNVVEIRKNGGINSAGMNNNFGLNVPNGAVEFWLYKDTDSGTDATFFSVVSTHGFEGNAQGVILDGDFYYMPSDFGSRVLVASNIITINTWHHLLMEFNISIGWQITIDGILYGQNYSLPLRAFITGNQMKSFFVQTLFSGGASNYGSWVDAVGYSWDPNYNIGDNIEEGLLLSFENSTTLDWIGYSLDGQATRSILGNTTITMPGDGEHTIQVFGNDSIGTMYHSIIRHFTIVTENIAPDITINLPISDGLFGGAAPSFDLTIIESNLDTIWYTLDGGLTTFITTEPTGMIDPDYWLSRPDGPVTVGFYANDTTGNVGYEDVNVTKDTTLPVITIISPIEGQEFTDRAPSYELEIDEAHLDQIWYTLDNGIFYFWDIPSSGRIDNIYWNALPPGYYILKFYANDTLGHVDFSEVEIRKTEPIIPGYNLIILSLGISVALMYIARRIKKKLK